MSGISTTLLFKEEFDKKELLKMLNSFGDCISISENEYELVITERLKDDLGEFDLKTEICVLSSNNSDENYGYNEEDWIKIVRELGDFNFTFDITFMSRNERTNNYLKNLFFLIKEHNDFYFVNNKFDLKLLKDKEDCIKVVNQNMYLIPSKLIEYILENKLNIGFGYN